LKKALGKLEGHTGDTGNWEGVDLARGDNINGILSTMGIVMRPQT